jgi:cytoskeletal protein CcmA (bactofilin family)
MAEQQAAPKTVLAEDAEVMGSIKCTSDIEVSGKVNGDINCAGDTKVMKTAVVKGNISANTAAVLGQVTGNVSTKDKLELRSTARINGDVRSKRLVVEDGVTLVGKFEINSTGAAMSRPAPADLPAPGEGGDADPKAASIKEEIRQNVKDEVKSKSGGLFGKKA